MASATRFVSCTAIYGRQERSPFYAPSMWVLCAFFETAATIIKSIPCLCYIKYIENQSDNHKNRPFAPPRPFILLDPSLVLCVAMLWQPINYLFRGISSAARPTCPRPKAIWRKYPPVVKLVMALTVARTAKVATAAIPSTTVSADTKSTIAYF